MTNLKAYRSMCSQRQMRQILMDFKNNSTTKLKQEDPEVTEFMCACESKDRSTP